MCVPRPGQITAIKKLEMKQGAVQGPLNQGNREFKGEGKGLKGSAKLSQHLVEMGLQWLFSQSRAVSYLAVLYLNHWHDSPSKWGIFWHQSHMTKEIADGKKIGRTCVKHVLILWLYYMRFRLEPAYYPLQISFDSKIPSLPLPRYLTCWKTTYLDWIMLQSFWMYHAFRMPVKS